MHDHVLVARHARRHPRGPAMPELDKGPHRRLRQAVPGGARDEGEAAARLRPGSTSGFKEEDAEGVLAQGIELLSEYQSRLAAQDTQALLVIIQAIDAAGKDGTIRHVMSGVNPQGVSVSSFKVPSSEEMDHDFMWRYHKALPGRGMIGIFNRSYYEEMLVVRVHPAILEGQKLPTGEEGQGHLGPALPAGQRLGGVPLRPGLHDRQAVPQPVEGGAAQAVPGPDRRAGQELEVQRRGREGARRTGTTTRRRSPTSSRAAARPSRRGT